MIRLFLILCPFLLTAPAVVFGGTVNLTTYYPAPTGNFDKITANNVGIGTTADNSGLRIMQGSTWSNFDYGADIVVGGNRHNAIGILDSTYSNPWAISNVAGGLNFSQMPALTDTTTAPRPRVTLDSSGNVGIGITTPQTKVHIVAPGGWGSEPLRLQGDGLLLSGTDTSDFPRFGLEYYSATSDVYFSAVDSGWFHFMDIKTDGTKNILVNPGGNVGIGLSSAPIAKLEVADGNAIKIGSTYLSSGLAHYAHLANESWYNGSTWKGTGTAGSLLQLNGQNVYFWTNSASTSPVYTHTLTINSSGKLDVNTSGDGMHVDSTSANYSLVYGTISGASQVDINNSSGALSFHTGGSERMNIDSTGNVGINASPTHQLEIGGSAQLSGKIGVLGYGADSGYPSSWVGGVHTWDVYAEGGLGVGTGGTVTAYMDRGGTIWAQGTITAQSDGRLKKNVRTLQGALDKIDALRGVSFEWNDKAVALGHKSGEKNIGMIAQELQKVYPELVVSTPTGNKAQQYLAIDYGKFTAVLLQSVKELKAQVEDLKKEVAQLKEQQRR